MNSPTESDEPFALVAVVGAEDSGKAEFIKSLTNTEDVREDDSINALEFFLDATPIVLLVTPTLRDGIDVSDVLQMVKERLRKGGVTIPMLDGIIYLQDVSNIGMEILTSDQLTAIHEFCGLQNLTMVMTMRQDYPVSQNSWKQKMSEEPFKAILEQGAHLVRYYGDAATALSLFPRFLRTQGQPQGDQEDPIHTPSTEADVGSLGMIFDEESGGLQGLGGTGEVKGVDVPRWPSVNGGQWNFGHEPKRGSEAVKEAAPAGREDTDSEHVALVNQLKKQHSAITQSLNKMLEDERQLRIQTQNTLEEAQREQISLASKHEVQIAEANTRYHQAIEELQKVKQERDNNNAYIREMKSNFDRQKATLRAELTKLKQELDARPVMTIDNGGEEGGGNAHLDGRSDLVPPESDIGNSTSGNGGGDRPGKVTWWRKLVC